MVLEVDVQIFLYCQSRYHVWLLEDIGGMDTGQFAIRGM